MKLLVALPYHNGDAALMLKNLRWQRELCGQQLCTAILCQDQAASPGAFAVDITQAATAAFSTVLRYRYPATPQNTWPQGPNWAFQHTALHMQRYGLPWLWLEADAIPLKRDWLAQLEAEYYRVGRPFMGYVVPEFLHMNGVGIYPPDTPDRIPGAMRAVSNAWDAEMRPEMINDCHNAHQLFCHAWGQLPNGTIHHRDGAPPVFDEQAMRFIKPSQVLVHRDKRGLVIDLMRNRLQKQRMIPLSFCGDDAPAPKVEIFIVSYLKDIDYLRYNLQSIRKFAVGFSGVTLLVPTHEKASFVDLADRFSVTLKDYKVHDHPQKWHLGHQIEKCRADFWCPEADFILFTDSDCIFTEPVSPWDYFVDGKPVLCVEEYSRMQNVPWKPTVEAALKVPAPFLTMMRHPSVHYPAVLEHTRRLIESAHSCSFEDYVFSCKADFPWGFSEFSTIGTVAMMPGWREKYRIIDFSKERRPKDKLTQFWSHSPPSAEQHLPSVGGMATPQEIIERALK